MIEHNLFAEKEFKKMNSNFIFPQSIVDDVNLMFEAGEKQNKDFSDSRFVTGKLMVSDTAIKRNSFKLPSSASTLKVE